MNIDVFYPIRHNLIEPICDDVVVELLGISELQNHLTNGRNEECMCCVKEEMIIVVFF